MSKIRFEIIGSVVLLVSILTTGLPAQSTSAKDEFANQLRSTSPEIEEESIAEILEIRERLGGGTGLELSDLFAEESKTVNQTMKLDRSFQFNQPVKSEALFRQAVQACEKAQTAPTQLVSFAKASSLRKIARKMDEVAADLEDIELFEDADFIRKRAQNLREKLRMAVIPGIGKYQR